MNILFDARFALRLLRRAPAFYATLIAVLVAGIGATTAMFSLVESLLLRPLPYPDSGRICMLWRKDTRLDQGPASVADFLDFKEQGTTFEHMSAVDYTSMSFAGAGQRPVALHGARVSGDFFPIFGVTPLQGRLFSSEDDRVGAPRVVVLAANVWRTRFGADATLVGRAVSLDGEPYTVIGVAQDGFVFSGPSSDGSDFWIPIAATLQGYAEGHRGDHFLHVVGKRKAGVSLAEAEAQIVGIAKSLEVAYPNTNSKTTAFVTDLHEDLVSTSKSGVWVLFAAIVLVFLIVCANVANLLLTRAQARRAEMAARAALGATPGRLAAQVVTETAVVFLLGALGGAALAHWLVNVLAENLVDSGGAHTIAIGVDALALGFCVLVSGVAGLAFGLVPALAVARVEPQAVLQASASRAGIGKRQTWTRNALVVAQFALATALLAGSGLALKAFAKVAATPPGFDPENLGTARVILPETKYKKDEDIVRFFDALVAKVAAEPGVVAVTANATLPMAGSNSNGSFEIEGRPPWPPGESPNLERNTVTPGYFAAMGIPILRGRDFTAQDRADTRKVMIISQATAERFFPGEDPIGRRIDWGDRESDDHAWREIVGIAGDVHKRGLDRPAAIESYAPLAQHAESWMTLAIRSPRAAAVLQDLPKLVESVDTQQAVSSTRMMSDRVAASIGAQRYVVELLGAFAVAALVLATLGLFGLVSYSTAQRTRELGIRMVLGSTPEGVVALVLRSGLRLLGIGLAIGLLLALAVGRVLASKVAGVSAFDLPIYAAIPAVLFVAGLLASLVPAWRVVRIPPAIALRYE